MFFKAFTSWKGFLRFALFLVALCSVYYVVSETIKNGGDIRAQLTEVMEDAILSYRVLELRRVPSDSFVLSPLAGILPSEIEDTWHAPRSDGREHEGIDIFADRGTPIYPAVHGYVVEAGINNLGGNYVSIIGAGGVEYYYAHLDFIPPGIDRGKYVATNTIIGLVGTTGNATSTPPHLHFGMYVSGKAQNPYFMLVERP